VARGNGGLQRAGATVSTDVAWHQHQQTAAARVLAQLQPRVLFVRL